MYKRAISLLLVFCLLAALMPNILPKANAVVPDTSNVQGGFLASDSLWGIRTAIDNKAIDDALAAKKAELNGSGYVTTDAIKASTSDIQQKNYQENLSHIGDNAKNVTTYMVKGARWEDPAHGKAVLTVDASTIEETISIPLYVFTECMAHGLNENIIVSNIQFLIREYGYADVVKIDPSNTISQPYLFTAKSTESEMRIFIGSMDSSVHYSETVPAAIRQYIFGSLTTPISEDNIKRHPCAIYVSCDNVTMGSGTDSYATPELFSFLAENYEEGVDRYFSMSSDQGPASGILAAIFSPSAYGGTRAADYTYQQDFQSSGVQTVAQSITLDDSIPNYFTIDSVSGWYGADQTQISTIKINGQSIRAILRDYEYGEDIHLEIKVTLKTNQANGFNGWFNTNSSAAVLKGFGMTILSVNSPVLATGNLKISKTVPDADDTDLETDFDFTVTLTDANGSPLTATYPYKGSKSGTITSGGVIKLRHGESVTIENLPVGAKYTVKETASEEYTPTVKGDKGVIQVGTGSSADFTNNKLGSVTVTKTSEDGLVAGMTFWLHGTSQAGRTVDMEAVTDAFGVAFFDKVPIGDSYIIEEKNVPERYCVPDPIRDVAVAGSKDTKVTVHNALIRGTISIFKHMDRNPEDMNTPETDAQFEVWLKSAGSYENAKQTEREIISTDATGNAVTKDLPYGVYVVHQIQGHPGTTFMADFEVFIKENGKDYHFVINNDPFFSHVKIVKVDRETGEQVAYAGAMFQIYYPNDPEQNPLFDGGLVTMNVDGTTMDAFSTNSEGYLITPLDLPYGKGYQLVEVQAPYGYVLDDAPIVFDITYDTAQQQNDLTVVEVTRDNLAQKGVIVITKMGEVLTSVTKDGDIYQPVYAKQPLAGAVYEIVAVNDVYTQDGTLRYKAGEVVDTVTTGSSGYGESKDLYLGEYLVREIKAPENMLICTEVKTVNLEYAGQYENDVHVGVPFLNERQLARISMAKTIEVDDLFDLGMNNEIGDVTFGLFAAETFIATDGSEIPKDGLLEVVTIPEGGKLEFATDIPVGSYYVQEMTTDIHYVLPDTKYPVDFVYAGQDTPLVQFDLNDGQPIENRLIRGTIQGLKLDRETKEPVPGAVFGLFRAEETNYTAENALMTATSGEDGVFTFEGIPYGGWVVGELSPADGFLPGEVMYRAWVEKDGQLVTIDVDNDRIPELATVATINGEHEVTAMDVLTVADEVSYKHLVPGREYELRGILINKATGEPLLIDGQEVTGSTAFAPDAPGGSVVVNFTLDAEKLTEDTEIVVFETIYYKDGKELAFHKDLADLDQTVMLRFPTMVTSAYDTDSGTKSVIADPQSGISDDVSLGGLVAGKEYRLWSIIINDSANGKYPVPAIFNGRPFSLNVAEGQGAQAEQMLLDLFNAMGIPYTTKYVNESTGMWFDFHSQINIADAEAAFTNPDMKDLVAFKVTDFVADSDQMDLTVRFDNVNTSANGGENLRFFQILSLGDRLLLTETVSQYKDETVKIQSPEITTFATINGGKTVVPVSKGYVVDIVSYKNVLVDKEYTIQGILMDKSTGKPLVIDGKVVYGMTKFTPTSTSGNIGVVFEFDATGIEGKDIVVFEWLYRNGSGLAAHSDIKDPAQTVSIDMGPPKTGDQTPLVLMIVLLCLSGAGAILSFILIRRGKRRNSK